MSASILVAEGDTVLHRGAYGDEAAPGVAMTTETVADVGSLSKQFTATLVMMEVSGGEVSLEDTVSKFFADAPADKREITLHQLMTHTSGLTEHSDDDYAPMTRSQALQNIFTSELAYSPGEDFRYSNSGFTLLAAILEEITGEQYTTLVRERLLKPAGLKDTGFHGDAFLKQRNVAVGFVNGEWQASPVTALPIQWGVMGNGGVMSTVDDMHRWMLALKSGSVLPLEHVEKLWAGHVQRREGISYGYGWWIYESPLGRLIWHGGTGAGGNADVAYFLEKELISIIVSNQVELITDPETMQYVRIHLPAREARIGLMNVIAEGDAEINPSLTLDRTQSED
ncbi:serine hydrolase [Hyphococcus flavus]|uniref:Serine hydrolase n=1 Tax=Hyphococcus flavus TaxID=1866326 RepID=A0AAE9ZF03_9PROT|nr:serine hydrolase domain-containing protein [Hyphococcus flavus]WDI32540.1 serine hydrolase [Hyphococcus flavus]